MVGETNTSMISIEIEGFFQFPMYHERRLVLSIIFTDKKKKDICESTMKHALVSGYLQFFYYIYDMP
jgi:hypothetical protein